MVVTAYEPGGDEETLRSFSTSGQSRVTAFTFNSGAKSGGLYLDSAVTQDQPKQKENVQAWLNKHHGKKLEADTELAVGYSKEAPAAELYLETLTIVARLNPAKKFLLVLKDFPTTTSVANLPPNLELVRVKSLPHSVLRALIATSDISPLVTGDVSMSIAFSSATAKKSFVVDVPPWKAKAAIAIAERLTTEMGNQKELADLVPSLFINSVGLEAKDAAGRAALAENLAASLVNSQLQSSIYSAVEKLKPSFDLLSNTSLMYTIQRMWHIEIESSIADKAFLGFVFDIFQKHRSLGRVAKAAAAILNNPQRTGTSRLMAAMVYLKAADSISDKDQESMIRLLAEAPGKSGETKRLRFFLSTLLAWISTEESSPKIS